MEVGYNERLDGLQAAVLRVKLPHLDEWNGARRAGAARYRQLLPGHVRVLEERLESPCIYGVFPARFADRDRVAATLRSIGIQTGVHYTPAVHGHPVWRDTPLHHGELPAAEAWATEELSPDAPRPQT